MLTIRSEQSEALRKNALKPVREKFIAILRRNLPDQTARQGDAALDALCDKGIMKASRYGIETEYNVYVFIAAMVVLGEDFDRSEKTAWSREILTDVKMHQDLKAKLLELRVLMDTKTDIAPHG
ncbi:MAG: hypothetical protein NEA02_01120 [Thermoanaerobaculia bacterium]|nr:hypothetical protein [Thermoanaerobaculia bacterium]